MAGENASFTRKLSAEETRGNYVTIQKRDLELFPKLGKPFKLKCGKDVFEVFVSAVDCWCQGPRKPHQHYRINLDKFRDKVRLQWGKKVRIEKKSDEQYILHV